MIGRLSTQVRMMIRTMIRTTTLEDVLGFGLAIAFACALSCGDDAIRRQPRRVAVDRIIQSVSRLDGEVRYLAQISYLDDEVWVGDTIEIDQGQYVRLQGHIEACLWGRRLDVCRTP